MHLLSNRPSSLLGSIIFGRSALRCDSQRASASGWRVSVMRLSRTSFVGLVLITLAMAGLPGLTGCGGGSSNNNASTPLSPSTLPQACSGQSLIGIDPGHNIAFIAIYALDAAHNAQLAVVDLTVGAASPIIATVSLVGSEEPISVVYNPSNQTMLAEARDPANRVHIYEISTSEVQVEGSIVATGLTDSGMSGGMVEDFKRNRAIVGGDTVLGLLDTSVSPPLWNPASIVNLEGMGITLDSIAVNSDTALLFISSLGANLLIDTSRVPLMMPVGFQIDPNESFSNGVAFDFKTNILFQSQMNGADSSYAFNFNTLNMEAMPAYASNVYIGGLGTLPPTGQGPGGLTVVNCVNHQGLVVDQFGQNLKLIQLPKLPPTGGLDNNGQPGSGTSPDAASAYTIAAALIPKGMVDGKPTQLGVVDNPSSLAIDPVRNLGYMLADTVPAAHPWMPGAATPLFLVRVALSNPVFGASPTGGVDHHTFWNPASAAIPMP
jgi:hypothetical protein